MRDAVRHFIAEFIGVFALVFVGSGSIMMARQSNATDPLVIAALAHGVILAVMVTATMRISGHLNPAITLGFLVTRRIEGMMAGIYIVAQLLGAVAAAYALKVAVPPELFEATRGGGQSIALDVTAGQAFILEMVATFFLSFVVFGTAVDPHAPKVGGFAIGLTLTAGILAIGPLTGASLNPARSLGPAIATGIFEGQVVYWTAPIVGAMLAAGIYEAFLIRHPVELPLHGAVQPEEPPPPTSDAPRARRKR